LTHLSPDTRLLKIGQQPSLTALRRRLQGRHHRLPPGKKFGNGRRLLQVGLLLQVNQVGDHRRSTRFGRITGL